ncbi:succinyldiaminopimelate transaminase [Chromatium weissei]|nr:succinyldiaminopimelate transaminase [Chromatium weissei]
MNPDLERLHSYPFEKLAALTADLTPPPNRTPLALYIGEPKHSTPAIITDTLIAHLHQLATYPTTRGILELRTAIAEWLTRRFQLSNDNQLGIDPEHQILPVNGTREALFAIAQAVVNRNQIPAPLVLMPNPFYQIYEGAALLAGAEPYYLPCLANNGFIPDFNAVNDATWERCQLLYICSPGNPTGAVFNAATFAQLIELAHRHNFVIVSDECYSEIYQDETAPPLGLLQVAAAMGNNEFKHCLVFHSLSKRSNVPGLRSGFVAGDAAIIAQFFAYRTYHGCAMSLPVQYASAAAWNDESHVRTNRQLYREKFTAVLDILQNVLPVTQPAAGFYLWPKTPITDTEFTRQLFAKENLKVLPGQFLSRKVAEFNPGEHHIRLALVPSLADCIDAAQRIQRCFE